MPKKLSHYDRTGRARMVDVSGKTATKREAEASGFVAAVVPDIPSYPVGIGGRFPKPLQAVTAADRVFACGFSILDLLASSAVVVSVGSVVRLAAVSPLTNPEYEAVSVGSGAP